MVLISLIYKRELTHGSTCTLVAPEPERKIHAGDLMHLLNMTAPLCKREEKTCVRNYLMTPDTDRHRALWHIDPPCTTSMQLCQLYTHSNDCAHHSSLYIYSQLLSP